MATIPLALVYDAKHQSRALQRDAVSAIAKSIDRIGLRMPITVRPATRIRDGRPAEVWEIVTGRHRVEAARSLGWTEIEAVVRECDETEARLWEIAENLHRAELTDAERRQHIAEWVKLTAEKVSHCETPLPGGGQPKELGIRKAAKELGLSKDTVARAVAAESLPDEVKTAADTAGLGTVKRAEIAKLPSKEAQMASALREKELAEAKKANRLTDQLVAERRLYAVKEWLAGRLDVTEMHDLGEMLAGICDPLSRALMREAA